MVAALSALFLPEPWRRFPRSVWPGRIMAAVALAWAALWLKAMPLGPLDILVMPFPKPFGFLSPLTILVPVALVSVCYFLDELLSCRALGGVMVLVPAPFLSAAQWHPSPWRYVILVIMYAMAVLGMWWIASPFRLRDLLEWGMRSPGRFKGLAIGKMAFSIFLIVLALSEY